MNGVHDMGGMHGMGPIEHEKNAPVFHAPWEGRVFALYQRSAVEVSGTSTLHVIRTNIFLRRSIFE